jgi:hypothetical protein
MQLSFKWPTETKILLTEKGKKTAQRKKERKVFPEKTRQGNVQEVDIKP